MGYYINETSTGKTLSALGKVQILLKDGAKIVSPI